MKRNRGTVGIATIENNNASRRSTLRATVNLLGKKFRENSYRVHRLQVSSSSRTHPASLPGAILQVAHSVLELRRFQSTCKDSFKITWLEVPGLIWKQLNQHPGDLRQSLRHSRDRVSIENEVTSKHQAAWQWAVNRGFELLVVLEDDAQILEETELRLETLFSLLRIWGEVPPLYVDIAGGYDFAKLPKGEFTELVPGINRMGVPQTNTAAGYLVSGSLAAFLSDSKKREKCVPKIGVDFYLNRAIAAGNTSAVLCLHMVPPALRHGSMAGAYPSWEKSV